MTSLARRIAPVVVQTLTSPRTREARRWWLEQRRRLSGEPHRVRYFHQVDDPYSQLAAQVLPELLGALRRRARAASRRPAVRRRGAGARAARGLRAPRRRRRRAGLRARVPGRRRRAGARARSSWRARMLARCARDGRVRRARAARGRRALARRPRARSRRSPASSARHGPRGRARRARRRQPPARASSATTSARCSTTAASGTGASIGSHHLERRLRALGCAREAGASASRSRRAPTRRDRAGAGVARRALSLEFYPSLRSPYTVHRDGARARARRGAYPVDLVLRPVLPMVMRGLPVPRAKQLYITLDTKREAEDAGVSFGRVCDPVGRRSSAASRSTRGRASAAARPSCCARSRAPPSPRASTPGATRACASSSSARASRGTRRASISTARAGATSSRRTASSSSRSGSGACRASACSARPASATTATWGQDRLWRVEQEIRRRLNASA